MPDVFISYSRKDKDFVRELHARLSALERDTWVDWEDIPLTADWWQEITRGIEAADSFLFIISPDSIASEVCNREIEHAIRHNKRLIPVVRREAVAQQVHEALSRHNWLFMREGDDIDTSFGQLMNALDTDLEYVREHTRLLVRAREWENNAKSTSYLLRGDDLQNAESWLANSGKKEPEPTNLQREYILTSRRAASARQRTILAGVSVAFVVAGVLAIISFALFGLAENRRALSDERGTAVAQQAATATNALGLSEVRGTEVAQQAATATNALGLSEVRGTEVAQQAATAIAAESTAVRRAVEAQSMGWAFASGQIAGVGGGDLALLLALQANSVENPPALARAQLAQIAYAPGTRRVFSGGHSSWVNGISISPDGTRLLTGGANADLALWDTETGELLRTHSFGNSMLTSSGLIINLFAIEDVHYISPTTALLLTSSDLVVWDVENWTEVRRMGALGTLATALDVTPDGKNALVGYSNGRMRLWNVETGETVVTFVGHSDHVTDVVLSADSQRALSISWGTSMRMWDVKNGRLLGEFEPTLGTTVSDQAADAYGVVFSPDERIGIMGLDTGMLIGFDLETGEQAYAFNLDQGINRLAWSPDKTRLFAVTMDNLVLIIDPTTGYILRSFAGHSAPPDALAFSPDGLTVYSAGQDTTIRAWWIDGAAQIRRVRPFANDAPQTLERLPDGRLLIGGDEHDPAVLIMNADGTEVLSRMEGHSDTILSIAVRSDGREALTGSWGGEVIRWDLERGEALDTWDFNGQFIAKVTYHPDETRFGVVWVEGGFAPRSHIELYDIESGGRIREYAHQSTSILTSLEFFDNGAKFAVGGGDFVDNIPRDFLATFDTESGEQLMRFPMTHRGAIMTLALSPDQTMLVSGGDDGILVIWDVATGEERRRFIGHNNVVRSVTFSADGNLVMSAAFDNTVRIWERGTWEELIRLDGHRGRVRRAIFSPNGEQAYSVGEDGLLIVWQVATDTDVIREWLPSHRYVREFTCAERAQYVVQPLCG